MQNLGYETFNPIINIEGAYLIILFYFFLVIVIFVLIFATKLLLRCFSSKERLRHIINIGSDEQNLKTRKEKLFYKLHVLSQKMQNTIILMPPLRLVYEEVC